ncbi:MAG: type IV toxin-antitoxin system AbiEi family antitoxin domain-containing protein [Fimbriimonadaceae bacterium]|nr:type IV toxin-antitoxin system AbiEi family antitoxin domain-containing protein [Fimbriimonadaceae bacterium]QYK56632.1 MAG: type IV toxin-antitoxin system AbiEi family antitoxin domain-containing protein [Fimbriimonadaceae bacterium]
MSRLYWKALDAAVVERAETASAVFTARDIAALLGIGPPLAGRSLARLRRDGKIVQVRTVDGVAYYRLNEGGAA